MHKDLYQGRSNGIKGGTKFSAAPSALTWATTAIFFEGTFAPMPFADVHSPKKQIVMDF